jgi:hypothetical protein
VTEEYADPVDGRQRKLRRMQALKNERQSWITHWREISEYQQPRLGRFLVEDVNKGTKRHQSVYDNTALFSSRVLGAGMLSGMTSPARPWFRLALADKDLMEAGPVKSWLHRVEILMRDVFSHSNTYRALHMLYEELGLFGTAATIVLPDFENVVHHHPLTVGEYMIATDARGYVDTLVREFKMTVGQIVGEFGQDACSARVKNLFTGNQLDRWIDVVHMIQPRPARDASKLDAKNMRFESCYFELSCDEPDKYLRESGFKRFPGLAPRWAVTGNDVYGWGPGMEVLGDAKQLQHEQLRKSQAIDYQVNPPLVVPTSFKEAESKRLPGGVMYADTTQNNGIRSAFEVNLNLQHLLGDIEDVRNRIRSGYYADLFLMLANDTRSGTTATEIAQRHEEKLLMLGPVLERLHNELLQPLVDMTFDYCAEAGILPPPPQELENMDLKVEFVSTLAQAQRMVSAQGIDRLIGTVGTIAQIYPAVVDKVDFDQIIDDYADMYGVNPEVIVPDDDVAAARDARAKQQAGAATAAGAPAMASAAKDMSQVDPGQLRDVMQMVQGYSTPTASAV